MNTSRTPFSASLLLSAALLFAACGSDGSTVASEGPNDDPTASQPSDEDTSVNNENTGELPADDAPADSDQELPTPVEGTDLGSSNMGGEIVDPIHHTIDGIDIMESYPEQLAVNFTAGAEPCLAATAQAIGTETQVVVTLHVGITADALTKSCLAGEFPHTLTIALSEGLDGRDVVLTPGEERPVVDEPPAQAFETTLIGLSETSAQEAAEDFGYIWRVVSVDGEDFAVTMDYTESRINATIVDGVVTDATIG